MAVRKTETRIPTGLNATDLGEAVVASDGRCAIVAFATSPVTASRENRYVVFVTDPGLAGQVDSYQWSFVVNGGTPTAQTTQIGETAYAPADAGSLEVSVKLLDAGSAEVASLTLTQDIGTLNPTLEGIIADAGNQPGPGAANPDVLRELVNDYSPYYQAVTLKTPEADDSFLHFLFSIVFDGAQQRTLDQREQRLNELAAAMNDEGGDVAALIASGSGVCGLRIPLLAMTDGVSGPGSTAKLPWTELPDVPAQRDSTEQQLCQTVAALDDTVRIDFFNIARFPRTNITACGRIIETIRDHYFPGTSFSDVLTGMSGTRAAWIVRHYREGPLSHS